MSMPRPPRIRDALLLRADQIAAVPLALIVAPAGSGKSTLLGAWRARLADAGEPSAYLDLSPLHANASVLVADLLEVARQAAPEFGAETAVALAQPAGTPEAWRSLARAWLRDAAKIAAPLALFLDNFHELPAECESVRWLDEVLRARAARLPIVIASRGSVPPHAARLRTEGALIEVTSADLSLRVGEVQQLLASYGAGDDASLAARVVARTEGWATGVQLAGRRLAEIAPEEREAFLLRLGREPDLFGFIAAEVLRDAPPELYAVLDAVELLERCAPEEVAELLDDPGAAAATLRAVDRGVLLGDGREVWVHQLWRDFVAERVAVRRDTSERRAILRSAGAVLHRRGRFEGALARFAEAEDWDALGRALLETAEAWAREGRAERVRYWIDRIPASLVDAAPAMLALRGVATVRPAPQLALGDLERAMDLYRVRGDRRQERALAGLLATIYLTQLRRDDALRVLRRMISLRGVIGDPAERGALYAALAQRRYLTGRYGGAFAMAKRAAATPLDPIADWFNTMLLAWLRSAAGEWELARREVDRVLELPEVVAYPFLFHAGRVMRARLRAVAGDAEGALEDLASADEGFRDHRLPLVREAAASFVAYAHALRGDRATAQRWYDEVLVRASERGGGADAPVRLQYALSLLAWGEPGAAGEQAQRALTALRGAGERWLLLMPWLDVYALWALARSGQATEAARLARRRRASVLRELPLAHHTETLLLADVHERAGDGAQARRLAREAFEIGARAGLRVVEPLVGDAVTPAWAEWALREGIAPEWALERLAATQPARVAPLLAELAADANPETRARAVRLLARHGGRDAHAPLRTASEDREPRVRDAARAALAALDLRPPFRLRIRSLGELAVWRGDDPVTPEQWKGQTARRLLARLLVAEGRPVAREQLREELWPDAEPESGRNNLRVAVTRASDALDPERPSGVAPHFVVSEGDTLRLAAEEIGEWDVTAFRAAARECEDALRRRDAAGFVAAAQRAVALYRGALLPEIDDEWVLPLRRELAERFTAIARELGPRLVRRARLGEAADLAERMLAADPADEAAFALRMRVALARGDRTAALRIYEAAADTLLRELDLEPGEELERLAAQARAL